MSNPQTISDLPLPPGYTALTPFNRENFRGLGRKREQPFAFARDMNALYLTAVEFFQAARHYPIVFSRDSKTGGFVPVAIVGLEDRQNLLVDNDGRWMTGRYLPAYARRWPFFSVPLKDEPERSLVCVDPAGLEKTDAPFIDANGDATSAWQDAERLINDMEGARRQTQAMIEQLARLELLEPFEAHAVARRGGSLRLANMHRVNEAKLNALPEKQIKQLMTKGVLSRIYAHLLSLENFQLLLDLRLEREQHEGEA
ncbi:MAG TPA: SapC family protein [Gammaproteobacteria bacterium]